MRQPYFVMGFVILAAALCLAQAGGTGPTPLLLWPAGAPLAQGEALEDRPRLTVFLPEKQVTRSAVVICPGGGYVGLATDHEGRQIAKWLNDLGIAAFMLEYRLGTKYHYPVQRLDVQRAIRYVRANSSQYGIDSNRIGVWGFSAGGHLASTAATHFDFGDPAATDPVERVSSRPDFAILLYPVIAPLGEAAEFSFHQILGQTPSASAVEEVSTDLHVSGETPPTFLVHADDDKAVLPENSIRFYLALKKAGVPAEMHILHSGGHGFGLALSDPVVSGYTRQLVDWLRSQKVL